MSRVILIIVGAILIGVMIGIIRYTKAEVLINKLRGTGVRVIVILGMLGCAMVSIGACGIFFRTFFPDMEDRFEALITVGVMILLIYILYKLSLALKSEEYKEFVEAERIRLLEEREEEEEYIDDEDEDGEEYEEEDEEPEPAGIDFEGEDDDFSEFEEYEKRVRELRAAAEQDDLEDFEIMDEKGDLEQFEEAAGDAEPFGAVSSEDLHPENIEEEL